MANDWERFVNDHNEEIHIRFIPSPTTNLLDAFQSCGFLTEQDYKKLIQKETLDAWTICKALYNAQISTEERLNTLISILIAAGQARIAEVLRTYEGDFAKQPEPQLGAAAYGPFDATASGLEAEIHRLLADKGVNSGPRDLRIGTQVRDRAVIRGNVTNDLSVNNVDARKTGGVGNTVGNGNIVVDSSQSKTSNLDSHNDYRDQRTNNVGRDANTFHGDVGVGAQNTDGQGNIVGNDNNVSDESSYKTMNQRSHNKY